MSTRPAIENLLPFPVAPSVHGLSRLLLRLETWLNAKASARALYRMDDRALSDIALSRSDVERVNATVRLPD
ncbi:hypothetical protein FG93_05977 [Bosea sp. LC85]|uniref:DUF1127 domain-containing protein n=1 Tax=Bosea sp. LC85 TaxID=1502851 RepID=UPI0004E328A7|nr:DUF1127 domain-containing protein [Bosea sp. LC85]KFC63273.1 hypothetical protein FG93_05977 [Bosea sp. LC85]